ncbi:hypothetical protein [Acuticoccus sediminis]|uniref:hypothetical protein n=1 Tax=Acuticoccus sediminis TaxID=2184697 RepID=UPI001CFC6634|nr:hypothetical protein [Acuticoccus sediminis]
MEIVHLNVDLIGQRASIGFAGPSLNATHITVNVPIEIPNAASDPPIEMIARAAVKRALQTAIDVL